MTNPSELVREVRFLLDRLNDFEPYLEDGETFRQYAGHVSPSVERLRALAADTIDRLTSSGEAYGWVFQDSLDPSREPLFTRKPYVAEVWRNAHGTVTPVFASPREGHVEVPVEPTEAMLDGYWHQSGESNEMRKRVHERARLYYRAMLAALPHNQGETKP